jgi:hypothetical protein
VHVNDMGKREARVVNNLLTLNFENRHEPIFFLTKEAVTEEEILIT